MSIEGRITPDKETELRKQTIEAVGAGTAQPTYEGMYDPEIANAFKQHLEAMSPTEFDTFLQDFEQLTEEAKSIIKSGEKDVIIDTRSITLNKTVAELHNFLALGSAGLAGAGLTTGAPVTAVLGATLFALIQGIGALNAERRKNLGEAKLAHATQNIEALLNVINEVSESDQNLR